MYDTNPVAPTVDVQPTISARQHVTGVILAGGMGRRMDGQDKGLALYQDRPMAAHALERLRPQVGALFINANRNVDAYAQWGTPVLSDLYPDFAGPLAGLHVALKHCTTTYLATAPCDSPLLPHDLVQRLYDAIMRENAEIAVAVSEGVAQPVFALYSAKLIDSLEAYLNAGDRKIDRWMKLHRMAQVPFDDHLGFSNINTHAELQRFSNATLGKQQ